MGGPQLSDRLTIKVFLSHKYEAPSVNQYFFQLFSRANIQFEIDKGKFSTNVTRLERMIRDADGLLAIHPVDDDGNQMLSDPELADRSKYFRLELDLAARSRRPGIALIDQRFRGIIDVPAAMSREQFDIREIAGSGAKPSSSRFERTFSEFCERVRALSNYELSAGSPGRDSQTVGLLFPSGSANGWAFTSTSARRSPRPRWWPGRPCHCRTAGPGLRPPGLPGQPGVGRRDGHPLPLRQDQGFRRQPGTA